MTDKSKKPFGADPRRYYKNAVILTDFHCGIANAQVEMRFQNVFRHVAGRLGEGARLPKEVTFAPWAKDQRPEEPPYVMSIHNVPFGNIDYASYALYSCYRALGRSTRPNIFIHVTDPGVGAGEDRSVLITDEHNVFVGPNNGSLSLMVAYFDSREIGYDLFPISRDFMEMFEQHRMGSPEYFLPDTFHGRDLLAVAAGMIAGGADPQVMRAKKTGPFEPMVSDFARNITEMPMRLGEEMEFHAFQDNTFGNLKTNISLDQATFNHLIDEKAEFVVSKKDGNFLTPKLTFPANQVFARIKPGGALLYLGSTFSPTWDERFVELAVNMGNAAERLGIEHNYVQHAAALTIRRTK